MSQRFSLASLSVFCAAAAIAGCTAESRSKPKIINGSDTTAPGHFASMLFSASDELPGCGATYLGDGVIVTAAHCVQELTSRVYVAFGVSESRNFKDATRLEVRSIRSHSDFSNETLHNDIALLFVDRNDLNRLGSEPPRARLADAGLDISDGETVRTIGFGNITTFGFLTPEHIQAVDIQSIPNDSCRGTYSDLLPSQICAGVMEGGKDSCQGDSGGPLYKILPNGELVLGGLVSYGWGCAQPDKPGIYTRVSSFRSWIDETIAQERQAPSGDSAWVADALKSRCYEGVFDEKKREGTGNWQSSRRFSPGGEFTNLDKTAEVVNISHRCATSGVGFDVAQSGETSLFLATTGTKRFAAPLQVSWEAQGSCQSADETGMHSMFLWLSDAANVAYLATEQGEFKGNSSDASEAREGYTWQESRRCVQDGVTLITEEEVAGQGQAPSARLRLRVLGLEADLDARVAVLEPYSSGPSEPALSAQMLAVTDSQSLLEIRNESSDHIYGLQLSCNKNFDVIDIGGTRTSPVEANGKYIHSFFGNDNPNAYLGATRGLRTLLIEWKGSKPTEADPLECDVNGQQRLRLW